MAECQIAEVVIQVEGDVTIFEVPAFTRPESELRDVVFHRLNQYIQNGGGAISVADFAMYLLAFARTEPREQ
jgi:hypothetical protein